MTENRAYYESRHRRPRRRDLSVPGRRDDHRQQRERQPAEREGGGAFTASEGVNFEVTITDSQLHDNSSERDGGGLFSEFGDVTITDSTVTGNTIVGETVGPSAGHGGGVYSDEGTLEVDSSRVSRNTAKYAGGGIFVADTRIEEETLTPGSGVGITDSLIKGNIARVSGGGVFLDSIDHPAEIVRTTISENVAEFESGGGVYLKYDESDGQDEVSDGSLTISDSEIASNVAKYDGGGVELDDPYDPVTIERTTVADNAALNDGGGIHLTAQGRARAEAQNEAALVEGSDGTLTIDASTVSGNESHDGGGAYLDAEHPVQVQNSTFSGNTASERGGGIFVAELYTTHDPVRIAGTGELRINNSTLSGNSAEGGVQDDNNGAGGGIYFDNTYYGDVDISSSIVANSIAGYDLAENTDPPDSPELTIGFSLIEDPGTMPYAEDPAGLEHHR